MLTGVRALVISVTITGCGFSASAPTGGPAAIDASPGGGTPSPTDAPKPAIDAPMLAIDAPAVHDCGASYMTIPNSGTSSKYRKVNTLTTWPTAKAACAADTAYLVIPETLAEGMAVFTFVDPGNNSPFYWAGIEDPNNDNVWTSVLGQTFTSPPFQTGQPTNASDESYILVGSNGRFYDWHDYGTQEYACECAP